MTEKQRKCIDWICDMLEIEFTGTTKKDAWEFINKYKDEADRLEKEYESRYGRICLGINEDFNWDWVKSPWPWERM